MNISKRTMKGLRLLGKTLPDHSNIELCLRDEGGRSVCHRFSVFKGVVHHNESHSANFVKAGMGPIEDE